MTLCIGLGNEYRQDDGVGIWVIRQLQTHPSPYLRCVAHQGDGIQLLNLWENYPHVILIDAVSSGNPPGTLYRFDIHQAPLPAQFFRFSSHTMGVAEAIELAQTLGQLPTQCIIYGIEGQVFGNAVELSITVQKTANILYQQILVDFTQ